MSFANGLWWAQSPSPPTVGEVPAAQSVDWPPPDSIFNGATASCVPCATSADCPESSSCTGGVLCRAGANGLAEGRGITTMMNYDTIPGFSWDCGDTSATPGGTGLFTIVTSTVRVVRLVLVGVLCVLCRVTSRSNSVVFMWEAVLVFTSFTRCTTRAKPPRNHLPNKTARPP